MPGTNDRANPPATLGATSSPSLTSSVKLTAADRCDSCGAQALARVVLPSGNDLLFCGHHHSENSKKLAEQNAEVTDSLEAQFAEPAYVQAAGATAS